MRRKKYTEAEICERIKYHMRQYGGILTSFSSKAHFQDMFPGKVLTYIDFEATILAVKLNSSMTFSSDRFYDWNGFVIFLDKLEKIVQ